MATFIPDDCIHCENCHEFFYRFVHITNVIDADKNDELGKSAVSGLVNRVVCPFCNAEFTYENPLVVYSNTSKIVCYADYHVLPLVCRDFTLLTKITGCSDWNFRLCDFAMNASEKIRIFKDNLQDSIIEILKLNSLPEYRTMILEDEYITYDGKDDEKLYFSKRSDLDITLENYTIPLSEYNQLNDGKTQIPTGNWLCIDRDWAIKNTEEFK